MLYRLRSLSIIFQSTVKMPSRTTINYFFLSRTIQLGGWRCRWTFSLPCSSSVRVLTFASAFRVNTAADARSLMKDNCFFFHCHRGPALFEEIKSASVWKWVKRFAWTFSNTLITAPTPIKASADFVFTLFLVAIYFQSHNLIIIARARLDGKWKWAAHMSWTAHYLPAWTFAFGL